MNETLMVSLVRQHELTEHALQAEQRLIEERRMRQEQLALTNAMRVSTVGELATGLAHELNQPLASISNLTEACRRHVSSGTAKTDKLLELLSDIADESMRAASIVAHLRTFVDRGQAQLEPVDLDEVVGHVPHLLARELERARITLRMVSATTPLMVAADTTQIQQVIVNLIQNAVDSIQEADGPRRVIELSASCTATMADVGVRDTGTGISDQAGNRMFEAFFTTKPLGLGMGLALSRSILEAHRGRIWTEAPPDGGPGIVVRFSIPLLDPRPLPTGETA